MYFSQQNPTSKPNVKRIGDDEYERNIESRFEQWQNVSLTLCVSIDIPCMIYERRVK